MPVSEMDPGADLAQLSSLGEERADLTLCSTNEEIASSEIHDMHSNTNTLLSRSCQTELSVFDRGIRVFKGRLNTA